MITKANANVGNTGSEKEKALELAIDQIEKQFGKGAILRLGSREAIVPVATISSASAVCASRSAASRSAVSIRLGSVMSTKVITAPWITFSRVR